jgi:hypothetical protein
MPWMEMATDAFETWMGFWTGAAGGKTSPMLEMQRQMLRAWTAPWMALGLPGFGVPEAARAEAPQPAPYPAPRPAPASTAPEPSAAREPSPPEILPWSPGPGAPVAVMGADAPAEARPAPPREAEAEAPSPRPRKAAKAAPAPRAVTTRCASSPPPTERSPATSGRRIPKPPRKPTH